ncbi:GntR family transcriptional regulator [Streptosporangium sp. NBC_01639]|uniref:GntR family transcriptional regulator n=1 Tax=unclassified Streptosporangium TaxID=2632669 RepID=UPI002DDB039C|nr:GntR family transcriptional regulator [Streptosporangium sp. NBC_01756]WSC90347.1 GntR family transcriptional regulator [Streptosporangium sp. NBC_01756]WTD58764.1 GntR family transcriptional regulator [Streptosporangium sp. NBC_01639]
MQMGRPPARSERLRRHLVDLVIGELAPHEQLPTERSLAEEFSVSRLTVRRVLDQLERDGRVYRVQGSGTFVSEPRIRKSVELTSFSEDMRSRGRRPGSLDVSCERIPAGADIGYALQISPSAEVLHIRRIRTADDEPMCLEHSYLPAGLVPADLGPELHGSLYEVLSERYGLTLHRAEQTIKVTVLDPDDARTLGAPPFSPAFLVLRTGFDARGRAIERAVSLYRGDRYSYQLTIYRDPQ